jgi:hypothetical protein
MALPKGVSDLEAVTLFTPRVHDAVQEDMGVPLGLVWEKLVIKVGLDAIIYVVVPL